MAVREVQQPRGSTTQEGFAMGSKDVSVTIGDTISVDPNTIQVKKNTEHVKWVNDQGIEFSVAIEGQTAPTCSLQGKKYVCVSKEFTAEGVLKYSVSSPHKPILDPDIEVIP
jgi:hypothetical protein